MKTNEIISYVETYGKNDATVKELQAQNKEIKEKLVDGGIKEGTYTSDNYLLQVIPVVSTSYDIEALFKKLGKDKFLACAKVSSEKLAEYLAPIELQKFITEVKSSLTCKAKRRKV